jgi:hypothetical protein
MAVGDVINGVFPLFNVQYYFQPAAGVEIMITFMGGRGATTLNGLYDGVTLSTCYVSNNVGWFAGLNTKMGINNTIYLTAFTNNVAPSYAGIQIK